MSPMDEMFRAGVLLMLSVIGYFLRMQINETKAMGKRVVDLLTEQAVDQEKYSRLFDAVVQLQSDHGETNRRLTDAIERLIRIEAHHTAIPVARKVAR